MLTLLNLFAAVALLVWGTHIVRTGMLRVFGADLRRVLSKSVSNRFKAFISGLGVTALVQSSSATSLIASSFVGQGLITLGPALAIMLGADVGTAVMAVVLSLDLRFLSPIFIFFGVVFFLARKTTRAGQLGRVAIGLGLILLALQMVSEATAPMVEGAKVVFGVLSHDKMVTILVGALLTVLCWSSLAVVLLAATFAATGVVSVMEGMTLVLGANLGSAMLALLVTMKTPGDGRRVAVGNLVFKGAGMIVFFILLEPVFRLVSTFDVNPAHEVLQFHVLFNVAIAVAFIGFIHPIARLVTRFVPSVAAPASQMEPKHLDAAALDTPALALANAARETLRIGDVIEQMLDGMLKVIRTDDKKLVDELIRLDDNIDRLYTAVKLYLTQISREALDEKDGRRWAEIMQLTINLEHVGDILERILQDLRDKKIGERLQFSEEGTREIEEMHDKLIRNLRLGLSVFLNGDLASAKQLIAEKEAFRDLERRYASTHLDRLSGQTVQSIETSSLHLDVISDMRRINSFFCSTAYPILERAGELRSTRLRSASATQILPAAPHLAPGADKPSQEPPHGPHAPRHREAL